MPNNLKTAIVTGASQGLGAAIALKLSESGFNVLINCHNENAIKDGNLVAENCAKFGVKAVCFAADVSKFEDCEKLVKFAEQNFNSIDCLVNNAGITKDGLIATMSPENFDAVTKVNYYGTFNMIKLVSKIMIKQRFGNIVNISSVSGMNGNAGQFNYAASKAGIIGMTKTAAKELGPRGIRVNAIAPGFIETAMTANLDENLKQNIKKLIALKRFGTPNEVANVVDFLCSDKSSYVTGQILKIDGCLSM